VLASREVLHDWIKRVEGIELKAAIQLLVISVVVLPVLPNRGYGPGDVLNPFELWWMVVVIVGLSFIAMAAVKWLGPHAGIMSTGLVGGLASSTAVAIGYARMAKNARALAPVLAAGVGAATVVKFFRAWLVAAIIFPAGAQALAPGLGAAALLAAIATFIVARQTDRVTADHHRVDLGKSDDLTVALSFAAFLGAVTLIAHYANLWFGAWGVLAISAVTGLVDVDAVTVSTARQALTSGTGVTMVAAVSIALAVNTAAQVVYVAYIAGRAMALRFGFIALAALTGLGLGLLAV